MTLTVLSVAYPLAPVGPDAVGGAEQVLATLDRALVERGHRSIVIAQAGSAVSGELVPLPRIETGLERAQSSIGAAVRETLRRALTAEPVDLVHLHGIDFADYLPPPGVPVLATLHLPIAWYPPAALRPSRANTWLHGVSRRQMAGAPASAALLDVVPNGVDADRLALGCPKRDYVAALGRICPEKGFHLALDAAKQAAVPLLLAGQVFDYAAHKNYYRHEILPRLDDQRRFLGPLGFAAKRRLLTAARALLVPSLCAETTSLVALEALACGTPVIAFANGALPEVVAHGRTGFLVHDPEGMAAAIGRVGHIDPESCRRDARERFGLAPMIDRYLTLYQRIASGEMEPCSA